jgi:Tfp pilus assembly protein PilO
MENLVGFNKREKLLILAAALCVVILLGDKFIISPMLNLWKTRAARIAALEESLNKGTVLTDREETLTQRWQESGLNVTSLRPRWIDEGQEARKLEFSLSATGSMESVVRFLYELERDPLAIRLEDVELATHDEQGREITLSARFTGLIVSEEKS